MKKEVKESLIQHAHYIAGTFSDPNRDYNYNNETFEVEEIIPLSEDVGAIVYLKNTGMRAVRLCLYRKNKWIGFFVTDSHLLGLRYVEEIKLRIERENFKLMIEEERKKGGVGDQDHTRFINHLKNGFKKNKEEEQEVEF